jgi:hypothetical protein
MSEQPHPAEDALRATIRSLLAVTGETHTDLGREIGLSVTLVGRRQRGTTPWSVAELGRIAEHWGIPCSLLFSDPRTALASLPEERVTELRTAKDRAKAAVAA